MKENHRVNLNDMPPFRMGMVISADGTPIGYRSIGSGPGIILMHAGFRSSIHYQQMAMALAETNTVHIPDRRGRGDSGPFGDQYTIEKEIEDLSAVMQNTDARTVFGHSTGGLLALEAAMQLPIEKLILYEPAVSINHSLPVCWLSDCETAVSRKQYSRAMAIFNKGFLMDRFSTLPLWILQMITALMLSEDQQYELVELLPALIQETKIAIANDSTYEKYHAIKADTLLLGGTNSPLFLLGVIPTIACKISSIKVKVLPGLNHTAPDEDAPQIVAEQLLQFLSLAEMNRGDLGVEDKKLKEQRFLLINDRTLSMEN